MATEEDSLAAPGESILEISVSDPVKQGDGVQAFVTYKVSLKTNMPQYRWNTSFVIRRFRDFIWLHDRLADNNKGIIIPPLPEKNVVEKFRFSAEFIEARRRALDLFMNRIASHNHLRYSKDLQLFLESSEDVWLMETAKLTDSGILKATKSDFFQIFKGVQTSFNQVILGAEKPEEELNPELESVKDYISTLESNLADAQKHALKLVKKQKDLASSQAEFGEAMILLGQKEEGALGKALIELGNRSEVLATKYLKQSSDVLFAFEEPLKEYVRMTQSVKAALSDQATALRRSQELAAEVESKRAKLLKLRSSQPPAKVEKIQELEKDIQETIEKRDVAKEDYEMMKLRFKEELVRFQEEKSRDLGLIFYEFAQAQSDLSQEIGSVWKALLPTINAARPSFNT